MAAEDPTGDWYRHFRKRASGRSFAAALAFSAVFHLSMVTVFRIVTYIPREDIHFARFDIVSVPVSAAPSEGQPGEPAAGSSGPQLALRGIGGEGNRANLQLPTIEFAELGRLKVREESVPDPARPESLFREPSDDSWARFSRGLSNMSKTLTGLRLSGQETDGDSGPIASTTAKAPLPASRPAEGFEAYVVWASDPRDRKLLFAPPIEALWNVEPSQFNQPIEMVLQVSPLGRVVDATNPNPSALADAVQMAALEYRFEPLSVENGANQFATLRIERERKGTAP